MPGFNFRQAQPIAAEEPAMRVRIIYGKLKPGAWDAYETAYKEAMQKAGEIPGL
jgi:hypothetical protein